MQISRQQWDRLGHASFERRLIGLIRRHHRERSQGLADGPLGVEIDRQLARATAYGLGDEHSAATYVHTAWLLGLEFDERIAGLRQILVDAQVPAARKAAGLNDFARGVFAILSPLAAPARATPGWGAPLADAISQADPARVAQLQAIGALATDAAAKIDELADAASDRAQAPAGDSPAAAAQAGAQAIDQSFLPHRALADPCVSLAPPGGPR